MNSAGSNPQSEGCGPTLTGQDVADRYLDPGTGSLPTHTVLIGAADVTVLGKTRGCRRLKKQRKAGIE